MAQRSSTWGKILAGVGFLFGASVGTSVLSMVLPRAPGFLRAYSSAPPLHALAELDCGDSRIRPNERAWAYVERAVSMADAAGAGADGSGDRGRGASGEPGEDAALALCNQYQGAVRSLQQAASEDGLSVRSGPSIWVPNAPQLDLGALIEVARAAVACGQVAEDPIHAVELATLPARVGARMADGDVDYYTLMIAVALERISLRAVEELLEEPSIREARPLARLSELLAADGHAEPSYPRAVCREGRAFEEHLLRLGESAEYREASHFEGPAIWPLYIADVTAAWSRQWTLLVLSEATRPSWERTKPEYHPRLVGAHSRGEVAFNSYGRVIVDMGVADNWSFLEREERAIAHRRGLEVTVAAWRYQVLHGVPPQSVADLVPQFLPAVPNDPFSEQDVWIHGDAVKSAIDGQTVSWLSEPVSLRWPVSPPPTTAELTPR